jgi:protein phosphatase
MATTVTAAYIFASSVMVVNVGDSRSYLLHDGGIQQITRDHTVAQYMRDEGLNPHAAHRYSNLLTRTFSTEHKHVDFDLFHLAVEPGDRILLCSDGLTDMLSNDEILEIANLTSSTRDACELLVKAALEKGGRDNVTVVLARV